MLQIGAGGEREGAESILGRGRGQLTCIDREGFLRRGDPPASHPIPVLERRDKGESGSQGQGRTLSSHKGACRRERKRSLWRLAGHEWLWRSNQMMMKEGDTN